MRPPLKCGYSSSLIWLCTSLSVGVLHLRRVLWSLRSLSLSCFKHVWYRFFGCLSLLCGGFRALFLLLSSSSVVGSRSATSYPATALRLSRRSASLHLATELLSARGQASACSGPCCESSSGFICTYLGTCGVTTVFCVTLINS